MKPTSHHYSALAIATTIFIVSVVGYVFMYYNINDQTAQTATAVNAIQDAQRVAAKQQSISDSLKATSADRALISSFLLSTDATVPFIDEIEGLSKQSGATVSLVSISADATTFHAHISIQGTWSNTMRAMHLIENIPYSLAMDNVRLGVQGRGVWSEEFDIAIPISNI